MTQLSGAHAFRRSLRQFLRQLSAYFVQDICKSYPNIDKNFVKLYSELQKLDHLTCSKLKI